MKSFFSVNSICWSPHERQSSAILACGSSNGSITILECYFEADYHWHVTTISDAHQYGCSVVSWSPETQKKRLASGGWDNVVKIWSYDNAGNWIKEVDLKGHSGWIRSVAWAKGSTRPMLASCSQDRTVIVWTKISGTNWTSQKLPIYFNGLSTIIWRRSCAHCFYNCRRDPFPKVAPFFPDLAGQFFL